MKSLITVLEPLSLWVLFSLLAIAFVGTRPYIGLAIAILGGVLMGLSSVVSYDSQCREVTNQGKEKSQDGRSSPWEWRARQGTDEAVGVNEPQHD